MHKIVLQLILAFSFLAIFVLPCNAQETVEVTKKRFRSPFKVHDKEKYRIGRTEWYSKQKFTYTTKQSLAKTTSSKVDDNNFYHEIVFSSPQKGKGRGSRGYGVKQYAQLLNGQKIVSLQSINAGEEGKPSLPTASVSFVIPYGREVSSVTVSVDEPRESASSFLVAPVGKAYTTARTRKIPRVKRNKEIYENSEWYPNLPVSDAIITRYSGYSIVTVSVVPTQYNQTLLRYFKTMRINIETEEKEVLSSDSSYIVTSTNQVVKEQLASKVANPEVLDSYDVVKSTGSSSDLDYLIITSEELKPAFQRLINQKISRGIIAELVTTQEIYNCWYSSGDHCYPGVEQYDPPASSSQYTKDIYDSYKDNAIKIDHIRSYIRQARNSRNLKFVLLGGDISQVPAAKIYLRETDSIGHYAYSDMYFACLDGTWNGNLDPENQWGRVDDGIDGDEIDLLQDVYVGRAPVNNISEASNFVNKTIWYENISHPSVNNLLFISSDLDSTTLAHHALGFKYCVFDPPNNNWLSYQECMTWYLNNNKKWEFTELLNPSTAAALEKLNLYHHVVYNSQHGLPTIGFGISSDIASYISNAYPFLGYSTACHLGFFELPSSIGKKFVQIPNGAFATVVNTHYGWYNVYLGGSMHMDQASGGLARSFFINYRDDQEKNLGIIHAKSKINLLDYHFGISLGQPREETWQRWLLLVNVLFGDPETPLQTSTEGVTPTPVPTPMPTSIPSLVIAATPVPEKTYVISGRVTGKDGKVVKNSSVSAQSLTNKQAWTTKTDSKGNYLLTIPSDKYKITPKDKNNAYIARVVSISKEIKINFKGTIRPDIEVSSVSYQVDRSAARRGTLKISLTNRVTAATPRFIVEVYVTPGKSISGAKAMKRYGDTIRSRKSSSKTYTMKFSSSYKLTGKYYLTVVVDPQKLLQESNVKNNKKVITIRMK